MTGVATIQSQLQLHDAFTAPMMNIINAVNMAVGAMEDMQQTASEGIDTAGIQSMRGYLDQAAASVTALEQQFGSLQPPINDDTRQQERFNRTIQEGTEFAGGLKNMIASAVGAYVGIAGIRKAFSFAQDATSAFDTQLNAERQLQSVLANTLDREYVAQFELETSANISGAIDDIAAIQNSANEVIIPVSAETNALNAAFDTIAEKASEIQSRGIYGDETMIAAAGEFETYFSDTGAVEMMMDTLANYAMGMSGGGAVDSTSMVNYATNLGKLMTGSYDAMTKKGFEFSDVQKAIIEGEATREQIIATLGEDYADMSSDMQAAATITQIIDEAWAGLYDSMSATPQGKIIQMNNAWGDMQETIGGRLYPAIERIYDIISENWDTVETVMNGVKNGLIVIIDILSAVVIFALSAADMIAANWSTIGPVIMIVAAAFGVYKAATLGAALAQNLMNGAIFACPIFWIIAGVAALTVAVGIFTNKMNEAYGLTLSFGGMLGGSVMVILAACGNLVIDLVNLFLLLGNVGVGCWEALKAVGSNIYTFFHNVISSVQGWFYGLLDSVLNVIIGVCQALNKIPFVDIDYSGLESKANAYAEKAAEANNSKLEYEDIGAAFMQGFNSIDYLDRIDYGKAFETGYYIGDKIGQTFSYENDINAALNSPYDYSGMMSNIGDIADNTGAIKDGLEITEEDLKYLRDIAEQEAINRFTTAEIKIEWNNTQNISSEMDLDGVVDYLTENIQEAMESAAEGVHV